MADFKTELEAFDVAIKEYQTAAEDIKRIKDLLQNSIEDLKNTDWKSEAGEAFFSKFNTDWVENIDLYIKIVELMNEILNETKNNFAELVTEAQAITYGD
jgi:WXG100 family type VII secretion target